MRLREWVVVEWDVLAPRSRAQHLKNGGAGHLCPAQTLTAL